MTYFPSDWAAALHADSMEVLLPLERAAAWEARVLEAHYEGRSRFPKRALAACTAAVDGLRTLVTSPTPKAPEGGLHSRLIEFQVAFAAAQRALEDALDMRTFPASRREFAVEQVQRLIPLPWEWPAEYNTVRFFDNAHHTVLRERAAQR